MCPPHRYDKLDDESPLKASCTVHHSGSFSFQKQIVLKKWRKIVLPSAIVIIHSWGAERQFPFGNSDHISLCSYHPLSPVDTCRTHRMLVAVTMIDSRKGIFLSFIYIIMMLRILWGRRTKDETEMRMTFSNGVLLPSSPCACMPIFWLIRFPSQPVRLLSLILMEANYLQTILGFNPIRSLYENLIFQLHCNL